MLGATSLLDLSEQQWRQGAGAQAGESALFLIDARDALDGAHIVRPRLGLYPVPSGER